MIRSSTPYSSTRHFHVHIYYSVHLFARHMYTLVRVFFSFVSIKIVLRVYFVSLWNEISIKIDTLLIKCNEDNIITSQWPTTIPFNLNSYTHKQTNKWNKNKIQKTKSNISFVLRNVNRIWCRIWGGTCIIVIWTFVFRHSIFLIFICLNKKPNYIKNEMEKKETKTK